jgi:hypothetical protein
MQKLPPIYKYVAYAATIVLIIVYRDTLYEFFESSYRFIENAAHSPINWFVTAVALLVLLFVMRFIDGFILKKKVIKGMSKSEVIRILGEPHRKTTGVEFLKQFETVGGLSKDSPWLQEEYWQYDFDEFCYQITFHRGKVSSEEKKSSVSQPVTEKHPLLPSTPQLSATEHCPYCGSSSFAEKKIVATAKRAVDRTQFFEGKGVGTLIAQNYDATLLYCQQCRHVLNDDLHGNKARAYSGLGDERLSFDIDSKVAEVMKVACALHEISDADVDNNFENVRKIWGCLKVVTISEQDLQSTVLQLIQGYVQEGTNSLDVKILTKNQNILHLSFIFDNLTFQGVHIARRVGGSFAAYGCVPMYRLIGAV